MVEPDVSVAVVTGGNRGIGLETVRQLCKTFDGHVYLTARDPTRGTRAVDQLRQEGLNPIFHQLDITDKSSIKSLRQYLAARYDGIDVLINNAGVAAKPLCEEEQETFPALAWRVCATNFTGTVNVCKALTPLLRPGARVVNVCSVSGKVGLHYFSRELREQLRKEHLTIEELENLMESYLESAYRSEHLQEGWRLSPYGVSKVFVSLATRIFQKNQDVRGGDWGILFNACTPSLVATKMTKFKGQKAEKGCRLLVSLATMPLGTTAPRGQYIDEETANTWPALMQLKTRRHTSPPRGLCSYQPLLML